MKIHNMIAQVRQWLRDYFWLVVIWFLAVVLWSYRINDFLFFGFEQGRDALVAMRIARLEDVVLVGPKTDIAGVFHGAWYYYLLAIVYTLFSGSPVLVSFFLLLLTSLVVPLMGYWFATLTSKRWVGVLASLMVLGSLEVGQYSRWLSNVTPALVLMTLSWWCVWHYQQKKGGWWFVSAAILAGFAAQFQIILTMWLLIVVVVLLASRYVAWPGWKYFLISLAGITFWYIPWIAFNIKYDFITISSVLSYLSEGSGSNLFIAISRWGEQLLRLVRMNVFHLPAPLPAILITVVVPGLWLAARLPQRKAAILLFGAWSTMTWPVIFFSSSLNLPQLYISTGIGLIGLVVLAIEGYTSTKSLFYKMLGVVLLIAVAASSASSVSALLTNKSLFFITIQDDLNLRDQRALLNHIRSDAAGKPYRLKAFTIPYYQEEGWQYLHQWLYGDVPEMGAAHIYVITERNVDPYWSKQWTNDLGSTVLDEEKMFGLLKLEKRSIR